MSEPDVTADDVQRFLKEVAKREVCPSCGTEEEPFLLEECGFVTTLDLSPPEATPDEIREIHGALPIFERQYAASAFKEDKKLYRIRPLSVICTECGKMDTYALDRILDWMKRQTDG